MPALLHTMAPADFGGTIVPIKSFSVPTGIISNLDQHSGNPFGSLVKTPGAEPRVRITMPFQPAYDIIGFGAYKATTFGVYLAKFIDYERAATSVHTKYGLSAGAAAAMLINSVSVDQDGDLMAEVDVVPVAVDDVTHPLEQTNNNALPVVGAQPILHTIGPMKINGTSRPGLMSAGLDLAQILDIKRHDGDRFPRIAGHMGGAPRMFGEHADPVTLLGVLGLLGIRISANLVQYFRRYDAQSGDVVSTAGTAISFTMAAGRINPTDFGASGLEVARTGFEAWGLSTGLTHPVAVSTSATVPAAA